MTFHIFLIWSGSCEEMLHFYDHLNNNDRNVKLCMEHSNTTIHFLDLTIFKSKYGKLHTNVYRKTTDINTMLKADSCFLRICDTDNASKTLELAKMYIYFKANLDGSYLLLT